jgi:hypothetical protein
MFDESKIGMPLSKFDDMYDDLRKKIWTIHYTVQQANEWHSKKIFEESMQITEIAEKTKSEYDEVMNAIGDGRLRAFSTDLLFKSFFIQAFSFFETSLSNLSQECKESFKIKSRKKTKGISDVENYKLHLEIDCGLSFPNMENIWDELQILRKIRNRIVHHNSIVKVASTSKDNISIKGFLTNVLLSS